MTVTMGLGYLEGVIHDYVRNGTTTLFAALDIANGQVLTDCKNRHHPQEYLQFLKQFDASVPPDMAIHLVVDNDATHKHPGVKRGLAAHPRYQVHYTPTYASWLNQVKIWFNIITQRAIRRGTFKSVKELIAKIEQVRVEDPLIEGYNRPLASVLRMLVEPPQVAYIEKVLNKHFQNEKYIARIWKDPLTAKQKMRQ
jgi:transposase